MKFNVPLLVVTNGVNHYACRTGAEEGKYSFLESIPVYCEIESFLKKND
jgi:hypothetical protein